MVRPLPQQLLQSLQGVEGFDEETFLQVHSSGEQVTSVRLNPAKCTMEESSLPIENSVPWCSNGYYLSKRPSFTFDPLFHAGCYYVQEASSMFLEEALKQSVDLTQSLKVLDLCAAPGGKSTHLQSLLSADSLLVSNEIIKGRNNILVDNIVKWGAQNVVVTANDPAAFGKLPYFFDVVVVDAPCSGSGLFRRDDDAIGEWSLNNVALCCQRQQRILADVLLTLKKGGTLIYSTCSYSKEEDEEIMDWLVTGMELEPYDLSLEKGPRVIQTTSKNTGAKGYRFFPDKVKGEGLFMACFKKKNGDSLERYKVAKLHKISTKEKAVIQPWIKDKEWEGMRLYNGIYFLSPTLYEHIQHLAANLAIQYAGVQLGEIMKEKLVPAHALALSELLQNDTGKTNLSYEEAIKYLQRSELKLTTEKVGWQVVCYADHNLGWINALPNRINNYYPKELRILKQHNG